MLKIIAVLVVTIVVLGGGIAGYMFYSARSLPDWFDESAPRQNLGTINVNTLNESQGLEQLLDGQSVSTVNRQAAFSDAQFTELFVESLTRDQNGQQLLAVSDAVKAFAHDDHVELTAVINLDKVEGIDPNLRRGIEKFDRIFPFIENARLALTVFGTPVVRNGRVGIKDDFHIKVGAIPISNQSLRTLGAEVERANEIDLALYNLSLKSIVLKEGQVVLSVQP